MAIFCRLYGGESCSQYVKQTLIKHDLRAAIALSRQRLTDCKTAKIILRSEALEEKKKRDKKKKQDKSSTPNNSSEGCFDLADCSCSCLELSGSESCDNPFSNCGDMGDCGSNFDCAPDCGNCDCSGCDCG